MPKINPKDIHVTTGTTYPAMFNEPCKSRIVHRLSEAGGITQFGAFHVTLPPHSWASQRHHHSAEDEFVYILTGHPTLIDEAGETPLSPGDSCAHVAGDNNPHHLVNKTDEDVTFIVVGSKIPQQDSVNYPDVDLDLPANGTPNRVFTRKNGTPY